MEAIKLKAHIAPNQELTWLEPLPALKQGEVEVILLYTKPQVCLSKPETLYPLRDKPVQYEGPFDGVAEDDWEAAR